MNWAEYAVFWLLDAFNKTALGFGVLLAFYLLYTGYYLRAAAILFIGVPLYFWLYGRFGGIPDETPTDSHHSRKPDENDP